MSWRAVMVAAAVATSWGCSLFLSSAEFAGGVGADASPAGEGGGDSGVTEEGGTAGDVSVGADAEATEELGLIGYWKLDDGTGAIAKDSAKAHNDGTITGDTSWTNSGKVGGALSFAGVSGQVTVPAHPSLALTTTFTLAWWMSPLKIDTPDDPRVYAHGYSFDVKINGMQPQLEVGGKYNIASFNMTAGVWHHYAVTFDDGKVGWYVDGFPVSFAANTVTAGETLRPMDAPIRIGRASDGSSPFTGMIDEVKVYARVLTTPEIEKLAAH